MSKNEEQSYERGSRMAWTLMLQQCLLNLGYTGTESENSKWIGERELAISLLREVCGDFGDNDWEPSLNLYDIIEKHLADYLYLKDLQETE